MENIPKNINNDKTKAEALEKLKQQKATVVNVEELAEAEARKAADAYMTESKQDAKGVKGFFKKIWKHTYAEAFYRGRQEKRAHAKIRETGNIYAGRDIEDSANESAMQAIAERFSSEYEGLLSKGEEKKILNEEDPTANTTRDEIKKMVTDYATGTIDEKAFIEEKNRTINSLKKEDLLKGANNYADNLLEIAKNARTAIEHGAKMEELDFDTNLIIGKAKSSLKTETKFNAVDKAIDSMKKTKVGKYISPASVSTALGIAYCIAIGTSKRLASSKAAAFATLGGTVAVSGAFAGMNESQRLALERKQHGLEMAEGGKFEEGSKRREQMERFQYEMESSTDLKNKLHDLIFEKDQDGNEVPKDIEQKDINTILGSIGNIDARRSLNQEKNVDLISYSNIGNVEKERTDLDITVAKAKVELRKMFEGKFKNSTPVGKTFDQYLEEFTNTAKDALLGGENGIDTQDKAFKKYKAGRVAKKVTMAMGVGFIVGAGVQEIKALISEESQGVVEGALGSENIKVQTETPLEHLRGWLTHNPSHVGMGKAHEQLVDGHNFKLPEGTKILENKDGTFNITRGDQVVSDHIPLHFGANNELDPESLKRLGEDGIVGSASHHVIDSTKEITTDANGYLTNHPGAGTPVAREIWYGNDTPMHQDAAGNWTGADQNELRTYWGGANGSGVNAHGDYEMDISHMTPDGSFQNGLSIDAQDAMKKGSLQAMVSLTEGTQHTPIAVSITPEGKVIFDHNNPLWQQIFKPDANGHMVAHVKYIEIVENRGTVDGVEHIRPLGTYVGEGLDKIKETVPSHEDIVTNNLNTPLGDEPPYFIPVLSRRPLEKVTYNKEKVPEEQNAETSVAGEKQKIAGLASKQEDNEKESNEIKEIDPLEYDDLRSDIEMINKRTQQSVGIIDTEKTDFASNYGSSKYDELRKVVDDKPRTINKEELKNIGDDIEKILIGAKVVPLGIKEIKKHLPKLEERLKIAKKSGDWELVKLIENKLKQIKEFESAYDKEMKKLRESLSKAEKAKNEEDVLATEAKIRELEKSKYTLKK